MALTAQIVGTPTTVATINPNRIVQAALVEPTSTLAKLTESRPAQAKVIALGPEAFKLVELGDVDPTNIQNQSTLIYNSEAETFSFAVIEQATTFDNIQVGNLILSDNSISSTNDLVTVQASGTGAVTVQGNNVLVSGNITTFSSNTVLIEGNLIVEGTTTTVNSTAIDVDDPILYIGADLGIDDNKDRGIAFRYNLDNDARIGFFGWDDSTQRFVFIADAQNSSSVISGVYSDVSFANAQLNSITFTSSNYEPNSVMVTDSDGNVTFIASAVEGQILQIGAGGIPTFGVIDGGTY